ncbi:response regulator [Shewanella sp. JM162201]|uniref:histidine kinase n=1 Tax=Shewanella jiangmenensis TaxID=2837387 RepID=A0ABS5VAY8_9GAMM|nr:ATP-binding protein [Shewanella jiangmenensis]MBT1446188.1 response regulator [Shewanella jiangmenensis]
MVGLPGKGRQSLGYKLNMATVLMAAVVTVLVGFYYRANMREQIANQVHHEMLDLVSSLNLALEARAAQADAQRVLAALATKDSIQQMSLMLGDTIVADSHSQHVGRSVVSVYGDEVLQRANDVLKRKRQQTYQSNDGLVHQFELIHLISEEKQRLRPYVVYVAYSTVELEQAARSNLIEVMAIQIISFLLLLAINTLVQQRVLLGPINRIRRQIVADPQHPIESASTDELGLLVDSYNDSILQRIAQAKELAHSRRYIDNVTDVIPVMLAYIDAGRCYRFVNRRYLQWLDKEPDEVLGHLVADILPPDIERVVNPHLEQALAGNIQQFEMEQEGFDSELCYFQATYVPDFDEEEKVIGFFACIEDLSRIKINERKIEGYAQELEFNNWALMDAREKAEAAARSKADFLACMSHEIRTPMNGVLGILSLLDETELSSQQHHYVSLASSSAGSLLALLNDILDFSKIESGKLEIEEISFDLIKLLDDFLQPLAIRAEDKGLKLLLDVSGVHQRWVKGDPSRIRQILINLVGNAIKFTEIGWIAIRVQLLVESSHSLRLEVSIEDTGIGIAKDKLEQLFSPFTQADSSTTRHFGGTGLGLSIAKRLCELMGGDIRVLSVPSIGSTFSFNVLLQADTSVDNNWPPALAHHRVLLGGELGASERMLMDLLGAWQMELKSVDGHPKNAKSYHLDEGDYFLYSVPAHLSQVRDELGWLERFGQDNKLHAIAIISHRQMLDLPEAVIAGANLLCRPVQIQRLSELLSGGDSAPQTGGKKLTAHFQAKVRLLLVEDNKVNQLVALGMLKNLGLETVDVANNGLEGLATLQQADYDLILMDCLMPEMDGYQATTAIRAGDAGAKYRDIPIIAMTANAMKGDREQCLAAGMTDYIAKPLDIDAVAKVLSQYVSAVDGAGMIKGAASPTESVQEVLFDREQALKMLSGDAELLQDILLVFREEMAVHRDAFVSAMAQRNVVAVRNAAHSIKGAAGNLSMKALAKSARDMEQAAREQDWSFIEQQQDDFLILLENTLELAEQ